MKAERLAGDDTEKIQARDERVPDENTIGEASSAPRREDGVVPATTTATNSTPPRDDDEPLPTGRRLRDELLDDNNEIREEFIGHTPEDELRWRIREDLIEMWKEQDERNIRKDRLLHSMLREFMPRDEDSRRVLRQLMALTNQSQNDFNKFYDENNTPQILALSKKAVLVRRQQDHSNIELDRIYYAILLRFVLPYRGRGGDHDEASRRMLRQFRGIIIENEKHFFKMYKYDVPYKEIAGINATSNPRNIINDNTANNNTIDNENKNKNTNNGIVTNNNNKKNIDDGNENTKAIIIPATPILERSFLTCGTLTVVIAIGVVLCFWYWYELLCEHYYFPITHRTEATLY